LKQGVAGSKLGCQAWIFEVDHSRLQVKVTPTRIEKTKLNENCSRRARRHGLLTEENGFGDMGDARTKHRGRLRSFLSRFPKVPRSVEILSLAHPLRRHCNHVGQRRRLSDRG